MFHRIRPNGLARTDQGELSRYVLQGILSTTRKAGAMPYLLRFLRRCSPEDTRYLPTLIAMVLRHHLDDIRRLENAQKEISNTRIMTAHALICVLRIFLFTIPTPRAIRRPSSDDGTWILLLPERVHRGILRPLARVMNLREWRDALNTKERQDARSLLLALEAVAVRGFRTGYLSPGEKQRWLRTQPGLVFCRLSGCLTREKAFAMCGRCQCVRYCSRRCQRIHWPLHQQTCFRPTFN